MEIKKEILDINISDIIPNRFQPRLKFDENRLNELANSIRKYGIITPILLRKIDNKYEIISGERRYKAAKLVGLSTIPSMIAELTDKESSELALVENIQREDLSALEEANSYNNLIIKENVTKEQISNNIAKNQAFVDNKLKLLELSEETKQALLNKLISEGHAKILLKIIDKSMEKDVLDKIISERLTVKETDDYIRIMNNVNNNQNNDIVKLSELNKNDDVHENVNQALNNIKFLNNKTIFNESQIDVKKEENIMSEQVNNNGGLNSFSNTQTTGGNFFPSLEDQAVNMTQNPDSGLNVGIGQLNNNPQYNNLQTQGANMEGSGIINNQPEQMVSMQPMPPAQNFGNMEAPAMVNNQPDQMGSMQPMPPAQNFGNIEVPGMVNNQPDQMGSMQPMPPAQNFGNIEVPNMELPGMTNNQSDQMGSIPPMTPPQDFGNMGVPNIEVPGMTNNQSDQMGSIPPMTPPQDFGNMGVPNIEVPGMINNQPDQMGSMPQTESIPTFQLPSIDNGVQNMNSNVISPSLAQDRIKNLVQELQSNGFQISLQENDNQFDIQIIINIKKQ